MKAVAREERRVTYPLVLVFALLAAGIVTAGMGFLALLGWVLKLPLLASFGADLIPMAPSTALLFLLYGVAVCLRARTPLSRRTFRISVAMVGLGTMVALLLFTLGCLNIHWEVEHPGLNIIHTVGKAPIGHMSPVAAFCFLLASLSFLASLSPSATRPWRTMLALGAAGALAGTCFIFLLAYFYGTPLLYGGTFIPPALNTAIAFVMLGLALMALAGRTVGLSGGLPGDGSRTAFAFALIFVLLAAGIVTISYRSYRNYERNYYSAAGRQLAAIAELKVSELSQYRKERLADATVFFNNTAFSGLVRRFFNHPEDAEAQQQIQEWIVKCTATDQYDLVRLLDAQGVICLSVPAGRPPFSSYVSQRLPEALRSGRVTLQDFHWNEHDQRIHLTLLVPILNESDTNHPLGILALRINPETYLYPFIQRWPVPSETSETLLVRRDGNDALFLNELKFQTNTALNLRIPLDKTNNPVVKAVLGQEGFVEGVDYRGETVLAALQAIPDSPWFLVARTDTAEVFAPMRSHLWQMVVMICVLILGSAAGVGLVWRHQRARFYRAQYESAEALRRSEMKFHTLYDSTRDAVMLLDAKGFFDCNPATLAVFGCASREEFCSKHPVDVSPPTQPGGTDSMTLANQRIATALEKGGNHFEWMHQRIDTGEPFPADVLLSAMELDGKPVLQAVVRDITERKQTAAYGEMGREILQILNEPGELQDSVQRIIAVLKTRTGFDAVGLRLQAGDDFPYFAQQGFSKDFLLTENTLVERAANGGVCRDKYGNVCLECTCGLVISGKTDPGNPLFTPGGSCWTNDSFPLLDLPPGQDPRHHPRNQCIHQGYASVALVPIRNQDRIVGLIQLNDRRKGRFTLNTVELLEGIAQHIGAALMRKQAEEALRASEVRFRTFIEKSPVAISISRAGKTIYVNQKYLNLYGFQSIDELAGQPVADQWAPEFRETIMERAQRRARGEPVLSDYEGMGQHKDGSQFPVQISVALVELPDGMASVAFLTDISERKRAEEKLRQLSRAVEQSPASIVITNPAGDIEYANPKFVEVTGYTLAEALGKNPRILKSGEKSPEAYRELWETILAGKEWRGEFHNKKKNGELYWESASISPIRDPAGRVTHYVAVKEDITARKQTEAERDRLIHDLQEALANIKSLSGLLPICAGCKKIRDDKGYWSQVESYISVHSEATFTHGLCPDCAKKFFPDPAEGGPGDSSGEAP